MWYGDASANQFDRQLGRDFPDKVTVGQSSTTDCEPYGYDADGNRVQLTYPDGVHMDYTYDGLDRLIQLTENGGTAVELR